MKLVIKPIHVLLLLLALLSGLLVPLELIGSFISLIVVPGFIVTYFLLPTSFSLKNKLILGSGVGVALIPLLFFLLDLIGLPINLLTVVSFPTALIMVFLAQNYQQLTNLSVDWEMDFKRYQLILLFLLVLALVTRLYPIQQMNAPLFSDPAVEATLSRLVVEQGKLPTTLQPVLDLELSHQLGFASLTASIKILSGLSLAKITLFLTNLLHATFFLGVYLLSTELFKDKLKRLVASLLVVLAAFPTYTFVAGMNSSVTVYYLLPFVLTLVVRNTANLNKKELFTLFLLTSGSVLIHPLSLFLTTLFAVPYLLVNYQREQFPKKFAVLTTFLLILPSLFILPKLVSNLGPNSVVKEQAKAQWEYQSDLIYPKGKLTPSLFFDPVFTNYCNDSGFWYLYLGDLSFSQALRYLPGFIFLIVFLYSLLITFRARDKVGFLALSWYLLLLLFGPLQALFKIKFPGWQFIYPTRIKFLTAVPLSLLLAIGFTRNLDGKKIEAKKLIRSSPLILILLAHIPLGLSYTAGHLNQLSHKKGLGEDDLSAFRWIENNTSSDAVFMNTIGDIEAKAFVGGPGQWLPSLTGRNVIYPATSLTENLSRLGDRVKIMKLLEEEDVNRPQLFEKLKQYNVTYIFISNKLFHSRERFDKIPCSLFANSTNYTAKYKKNDVCIFAINYPN